MVIWGDWVPCLHCKHFLDYFRCKAFPQRIPQGMFPTCTNPIPMECPGNNGIQYEPTGAWKQGEKQRRAKAQAYAERERKAEEQRKLARKKKLEEARLRVAERQAARFKDPELFQRLVKAEFERRRKEQEQT